MSISSQIIRLAADYSIKPFDCGNADLNEFLFQNAIGHSRELLAVTYLFEDDNCTNAYFSVLNDSIRRLDADSTKLFRKKLLRDIPHKKRRYHSYPAVKIGRFAVHKDLQNNNIGSKIMDYIKHFILEGNKSGCRFVTIDSYRDSVGFYQKNGFEFLSEKDKTDDTRLMYFDLKTFIPDKSTL
ncbi:MAG: GNAT family N-acetyltransferase [Nitrospirae bacterium]|nr:GNAT family N-acetyltransferase [Nitrospirota bacterium]